MLIQIIILIFIFFVVLKVFLKYRKKLLSLQEFILWCVFWILVAVAVVMPKSTDVLAQKLGVERGADLLVYLSLIAMFYVIFKIFNRLQKIERNITKIVRKIAKDSPNKKIFKN